MSNILENEIKEVVIKNSGLIEYMNFTDNLLPNLYQLTEEVCCAFYDWTEKYGWIQEFQHQETHTTKELFSYFINNVYKQDKP